MTDEELMRLVMEQLDWDARLERAEIIPEISEGRVVLHGEVRSLLQIKAAELAVKSVAGVKSVDNKLRIVHGEKRIDEVIAAILHTALKSDPEIDDSTIDFSVDGGIVTLTGSVDAYWKKEKVDSIAAHAGPAVVVQNKLEVVLTDVPEDRRIADDVRMALERMQAADTRYVTVQVENGIVTLTGKVNNWTYYNNAEYAARHTRGVRELKNGLLMI